MSYGAAKKVYFILARCGYEKIRIRNSRRYKYIFRGAVAAHSHNVIMLHYVLKGVAVLIYNGDIISFGGKLTRKSIAYLSASGNNYFHKHLP